MNQIQIQIDEQQPLNVAPFDFTKKLTFQDQSLFQLPERIKCNVDGKYKPENLLVSDKPEQLIQTTDMILKNFQDKMLVWDIKDFQFNIPPSYFNVKIEFKDNQNQIKKQIDQRDLTCQNIAQIFQTGTLSVPSANFPVPFVWKISGWIIKGRENIVKSYYDDLSKAYFLFRQSYERLYHKSDYKVCGGNLTIRAGILNILIKPLLYISMIIGFKETKPTTDIDGAALKLEEKRQKKLIEEGKFSQAMYKFLSTSEENCNKLKNYGQQFQKIADGIKFQIDSVVKLINEKKHFQLEDEKLEYNDQIKQELKLQQDYLSQYNLQFDPNQNADKQINNCQYEAQKKYWLRIKAIPQDVIKNIIDISECKRIYEYHYSNYQQSIDTIANQYKTELQRTNPIRSRLQEYIDEEMESYMNPIKLKLQTEMETNILNELNELQLIDRFVYQDYLEFKKNFEQKCQRICEQDRKYFTINITKECFIPYDVVKQNNVYELVRRKFYKIPTKYLFWKLYVGIFLYYTMTSDIIHFFYHHAIYGQLGLKVLFGRGIFYSDLKIDLGTGVVGPSGKEIKTISYHLKEVYEGMKTSRSSFELKPDNGFFRKSILRIFNLMEVYLYRFLFIGVFCISICFPILILVNISISLLLALPSWVYVPILLLITHIFTIVFLDIHYFDESVEQKYQNIWQYDAGFPIITNTLRLVFQGVLQLVFAIIFGFIIFPLSSLLIVVFAHLRYLLATLFDIFMICIISCLGRIPTGDSFIAWRISGPGIDQQYYNQILIENVLLLIAVEIEKIIFLNYQKWMETQIDKPSKQINQEIISQFPDVSFYDPGCAQLKQQLLSQVQARKNNYPVFDTNFKVRYTEFELKHLLDQVKQFLKSQIIMKNQQRYLWYYYNQQEGDYNALAKKLVTNALGQQVFEPISENELKFLLFEQKDQNLLIQQALEGQVDFKVPDRNDKVVVDQPINYKKFVSYENVITEIKNYQSQRQWWCSSKSKKEFYINYALK